jgi:putative flippase GtrA
VVDVNRTLIRQRRWQAEQAEARDETRSGWWHHPARLTAELIDERARPLRFVLVGGLCGAVQLGLFSLLLWGGVEALPANAIAFLLSAQLNFALSTAFIWHDRQAATGPVRSLTRRWLAFHGSIAATAALNQLAFALARAAAPEFVAAALGIGAVAVANFLVQDRLVFRGRHHRGGCQPAGDPTSPRLLTPEEPFFTVVNGPPAGVVADEEPLTAIERARDVAQAPQGDRRNSSRWCTSAIAVNPGCTPKSRPWPDDPGPSATVP